MYKKTYTLYYYFLRVVTITLASLAISSSNIDWARAAPWAGSVPDK